MARVDRGGRLPLVWLRGMPGTGHVPAQARQRRGRREPRLGQHYSARAVTVQAAPSARAARTVPGGSGVGGRTGAGGSLGTGGSFGVGGARDGGADATGTGGAVVDASTDLTSNGTGPCMGICAPRLNSFRPRTTTRLPSCKASRRATRRRPDCKGAVVQLRRSSRLRQRTPGGHQLPKSDARCGARWFLHPGQRGHGRWRGRLRQLLHVLFLMARRRSAI